MYMILSLVFETCLNSKKKIKLFKSLILLLSEKQKYEKKYYINIRKLFLNSQRLYENIQIVCNMYTSLLIRVFS